MKCKTCGRELREGASFCPECGTPTEKTTQHRTQNRGASNQSSQPSQYSRKSANKTDSIVIGVLIGLIIVVAVFLILFGVSMAIRKEENRTSSQQQTVQDEKTTGENEEEQTQQEPLTSEVTQQDTARVVTESATWAQTEAATQAATQETVQTTQMTTQATVEATTETPQIVKDPVAYPSYEVYVDSDYDFSIKYPNHFVEYNDYNNRNRYTLQAPDGTAELKIFSYADPGLSSKELASQFENTCGGVEEYCRTGSKYYAVRMSNNGRCYYEYGEIGVGRGVTGFTLIYDKEYHDIYDQYVNDIYKSRSWKK